MEPNQTLKLITSRRSIRNFSERPVEDELIDQVLEAGRWAPSGLNNQPWRFVVVKDPAFKGELAGFTKYSRVVESAPVVIPLMLHKPSMYNELKDYQAAGACLQNMLLMAHALGLGAVWLGEILNRADEVLEALELDDNYLLMAVVALGWPGKKPAPGAREELPTLILARK